MGKIFLNLDTPSPLAHVASKTAINLARRPQDERMKSQTRGLSPLRHRLLTKPRIPRLGGGAIPPKCVAKPEVEAPASMQLALRGLRLCAAALCIRYEDQS